VPPSRGDRPRVTRTTIALVWLGGTILGALLYLTGPAHSIGALLAVIDRAESMGLSVIAFLSTQTFDLVRAAAMALFAVFVVLGILASHRGVGQGSGLVGISVLFVVLIAIGGYQSRFCWFAALLVAGAGAISMTHRLVRPPLRGPWGTHPYRQDGGSGQRF
jgi:hypothetical protein